MHTHSLSRVKKSAQTSPHIAIANAGRHMPALRIGSAQNDAAARAAAMAGRVTPHDKSGPGGGAARG
jgi:hypothetical protein